MLHDARERRIGRLAESGQTGTEYMIVISVIVVAVVASAYLFVPNFRDSVERMAFNVSDILDRGSIGGVGLDRGASFAPVNPGDMGNGDDDDAPPPLVDNPQS